MSTTGEKFGSALKTLAKIGGAIVLQIVLFTVVGILLNLIFIPFLWPEMKTVTPSGANPGARAGGAAALLVVVLYLLPIIGLLLLFLVVMPLLFFFVGKKQGIKAGISKLIHEKGDNMVGFIVSKFTDRMANNPEWKESMQKNGIVVTVRKFFPGFIKTLNGLPWILKRPLKVVFEGIDFAGAVESAYRTRPDAPINSPETNAHITENISSKLKLKFPPPKGRLLLILIGINIVVFIIVKIVI